MPIVSQWKKYMKQDWTTASLTKIVPHATAYNPFLVVVLKNAAYNTCLVVV
jgi:hypothetical protein